MSEDRHAAVEMLKVEYSRAMRARWVALEILCEGDKQKVAATIAISLVEMLLELTAAACESPAEFEARKAMLGAFVAGYGGDEAEALWRRARKTAGQPT